MHDPILAAFADVLRDQNKLIEFTNQFRREQLSGLQNLRDGSALCRELKIPYCEVTLPEWAPDVFLSEAEIARDLFVSHPMGESKGWKGLCLHGLSAAQTLPHQRYGYGSSEAPYRWTEASERCPRTTSWLKSLLEQNFFTEFYRVRYMWLQPSGYVHFHCDRSGSESFLGPLNLALNMPKECHWLFRKWGPVPFRAGSAFMVDVSHEHGVWNNSVEDRIHLIVHGHYGPRIYEALSDAVMHLYESLDANERHPPHQQSTSSPTTQSIQFVSEKIDSSAIYRILNEAQRRRLDWCVLIAQRIEPDDRFFDDVRNLCTAADAATPLLENPSDSAATAGSGKPNFVAIRLRVWSQLGETSKQLFSRQIGKNWQKVSTTLADFSL